ncbi:MULTISPECIES: hypothetical protein [unclassified Mucilaginibacter]|uniref:hypothetical protein n=1 Tax=unclassified Mucilaginibacter TaxID=2617802 RepID=UPI002AC98992|nr:MULTISPECIES: hypothetical protein [unclassified Mucilaginibacter]MEB0262711.1 hypothetical protein [Mucilaginibacter sp. 10I4]MEB0279451.1 hypothetical protein [Mucilaginibacter sp. 10B2]MEB0300012.1 hypothetical protein [Mucilaginibacter sp. 5C4]WPX21825.1 hypothetical protein RHM67_11060 [Mucilaginibacter sp. 5C4]
MKKLSLQLLVPVIIILMASCQNNKPKPTSADGKTTITINGKKDSVLNNPEKNYGNATVAEPCVKCLIKVIQTTPDYKKIVANKAADKISYVINWDNGDKATDSINTKHTPINSLKIDVVENTTVKNKLASFNYNNKLSKLSFMSDDTVIDEKISEPSLKTIRNKCFWGVASSK